MCLLQSDVDADLRGATVSGADSNIAPSQFHESFSFSEHDTKEISTEIVTGGGEGKGGELDCIVEGVCVSVCVYLYACICMC